MIRVSTPDGTEEHRAAERMRQLMEQWHPPLASDPRHQVWIIANAQCFGERVQDVDVLVFASFGARVPSVLQPGTGTPVHPASLAFTLEVKTHGPQAVRFEGNRTFVEYESYDRQGEWKNATKQAEDQPFSVLRYLQRRNRRKPFIAGLLWLRNVPEGLLPEGPHDILGADASFLNVLQRLSESRLRLRARNEGDLELFAGEPEVIRDAAEVFSRDLPATRIDRRRMEAITKRWLDDQQYAERVGEQLLVFRGRAGTGKTMALLRIAHDLYSNRGARVLLLTYNRALVADIRRLLALLKIRAPIEARAVQVRTVHSFVLDLARQVAGLDLDGGLPFGEAYERCKRGLAELVPLMTEDDRARLAKVGEGTFDWDHLLIDEAQDWPSDERDILYGVFGARKCILADGVDQLVRSHSRTDWLAGVDRKDTKIVTLRRVRRLKASLCEFVRTFGGLLDVPMDDVEPDHGAAGGRVIVTEGAYAERPDLHRRLIEENRRDGNEPIDMLYCVTEEMVTTGAGGRRRSELADALEGMGTRVWDGVDSGERGTFPVSWDQVRVVQYDSCRGLEGWTVILLGFDRLYELKRDRFGRDLAGTRDDGELGPTPEEHAARWVLMAATRAIDTLVLQIDRPDGFLGERLQMAARASGATVEWLKRPG